MKKTISTPLLTSILLLIIFHILIRLFGFKLGSIYNPTSEHAYAMLLWGLLGSASAYFMLLALLNAPNTLIKLKQILFQPSSRAFVLLWSCFVLLAVLVIRITVFRMMPITDDEACYTFMSELLASGRLKAASHPARLFFDHIFMVNDGSVYSQYFIGWPVLLIPDQLLGGKGFINALYAALTVPPLFHCGRILAGKRWGRIATLLYATAPIVLFGAATKLSHTSCTLFLTLGLYAFLRIQDSGTLKSHLLFIASISMAFFIRPYTTIAFAAPLFVWWVILFFQNFSGKKLVDYAAAVTLGIFAILLFIAVLHAQTGNWLTTPYGAYKKYSIANEFRFSFYTSPDSFALIRTDLSGVLTQFSNGFLRSSFDLFGWPCSFIFLLALPCSRKTAIPIVVSASFLLFTAFGSGPGIDTYGPVKYSEFAIPTILLSVLGLRNLTYIARRWSKNATLAWRIPLTCCTALIVTGWFGYTAIRVKTIRTITAQIRKAWTLADAPPGNAVIFISHPLIRHWGGDCGRGFIFNRPNNDPDLANSTLWVNHLTLEDDKKLIEEFYPTRTGYLMVWNQADAFLLPLGKAPKSFPDGRIGGSNRSVDWRSIHAGNMPPGK